MESDEPDQSVSPSDVLYAALRLAESALNLYRNHQGMLIKFQLLVLMIAAFPAISKPIVSQVTHIKTNNAVLTRALKAVSGQETATSRPLESLKMQTHKPVPLPLLTPFIEDNFMSKNHDQDKQKRDNRLAFNGWYSC